MNCKIKKLGGQKHLKSAAMAITSNIRNAQMTPSSAFVSMEKENSSIGILNFSHCVTVTIGE
jgi:hypothetical protein